MVKITTDPKTYAVEPGGILRWIKNEDIAEKLYGPEWYLRIDDVPDVFFINYAQGDPIETYQHPIGSLIRYAGNPTIYYIGEGYKKRAIQSEEAFSSNRFQWENVLTISSTINYEDGEPILKAEDKLINLVQ